jgi:hypothetical protein
MPHDDSMELQQHPAPHRTARSCASCLLTVASVGAAAPYASPGPCICTPNTAAAAHARPCCRRSRPLLTARRRRSSPRRRRSCARTTAAPAPSSPRATDGSAPRRLALAPRFASRRSRLALATGKKAGWDGERTGSNITGRDRCFCGSVGWLWGVGFLFACMSVE